MFDPGRAPNFCYEPGVTKKKMKVKPATSFKLLKIFIHKKQIREDLKRI